MTIRVGLNVRGSETPSTRTSYRPSRLLSAQLSRDAEAPRTSGTRRLPMEGLPPDSEDTDGFAQRLLPRHAGRSQPAALLVANPPVLRSRRLTQFRPAKEGHPWLLALLHPELRPEQAAHNPTPPTRPAADAEVSSARPPPASAGFGPLHRRQRDRPLGSTLQQPPQTRHRRSRVHRTPAISCEAVPAVPRRRGHEAAPLVRYSRNQPGAAESLVSFIALFGGSALPSCPTTSRP